MRDERERTRRAFVKKCYDDQWRSACDEARLLDSKAITNHVNQARMAQFGEKRDRMQQEADREESWLRGWRAQMAEVERAEQASVVPAHAG